MLLATEPRRRRSFPVYAKQAEFLDAPEHIRGFVGGQGCLAPETIIDGMPLIERQAPFSITTAFGCAWAAGASCQGEADLYRVETRWGAVVVVTLAHRFLTPTGWHRLKDLRVGDAIAADGTGHERFEIEKSTNSLGNCFSDFHRHGESPSPVEVVVRLSLAPCDSEYARLFQEPFQESPIPYWDNILSIDFRRKDKFYDFHVPFWNHYAACGLLHHNCGKTKIGAYDLLMRARPGRTCMVVTDTYPRLRDATFRTFREVAEQIGFWQQGGFRRTEFTARIRTRFGGTSEVLFRPAEDPDKLRGPNISDLWIDEASLLKHDAYLIALARLREGGEHGRLSCTFTPKGLGHWTYDVFGRPKPGVFLVQARTRDNPFIDDEFIASLEQQFGGGLLARQELEGDFVTVAGAEWPPEFFAGDERLALENGENGIWFRDWPEDLAVKVMALDPSKGKDARHGDYSAFALVGLDRGGKLWVDGDLSQSRPSTQIVADGLRLYQEFRPQAIAIESVQFQELFLPLFAEAGRKAGLGVMPVYGVPNTVPKQVRIRTLAPYLAKKEMRFRAGSKGAGILVQQLRDWPCAEHDDGPDAIEMGVRMIRRLLGEKPKDSPELAR